MKQVEVLVLCFFVLRIRLSEFFISTVGLVLKSFCSVSRVKELPSNGTAGEAQNCMETESEEFEISREESDHILEVCICIA